MTNEQAGGTIVRVFLIPVFCAIAFAGGALVYRFWEQELAAKELYTFVPVEANGYRFKSENDGTIKIDYSYTYNEEIYLGKTLSPYPKVDKQALKDEKLRSHLLQKKGLALTVFVDPNKPNRSSLVRSWARSNRINALIFGGVIFWLGLALLYKTMQRVRRVEELF